MSLSSRYELQEVGDFGSLAATVPLSVLVAIESAIADVGSTGGQAAARPAPTPVGQEEPHDVGATGPGVGRP